jgi:hypothetical protein
METGRGKLAFYALDPSMYSLLSRKGDDDYDPTTLKLPASFLDEQTPAMR